MRLVPTLRHLFPPTIAQAMFENGSTLKQDLAYLEMKRVWQQIENLEKTGDL